MNIPVLLNGEQTVFHAQPDDKLASVLRRNGCRSVKLACAKGCSGSCAVLLNGKPVSTCKMPAFLAANQEIETLESFSKSDEYKAVMKGLEKAGVKLCGFCDAGKIFAAAAVIRSNVRPTRAAVLDAVRHLAPCCTDPDTLINGILYAFEFRIPKKDG
ncbi:MAG: (2Fe-2S)-binding protein [Treponema sp.]